MYWYIDLIKEESAKLIKGSRTMIVYLIAAAEFIDLTIKKISLKSTLNH